MVHYNFRRYQLDMLYQVLGNPEPPRFEEKLTPTSVVSRHIYLTPNGKDLHNDLAGLKDFLNTLTSVVEELQTQLTPQLTEQTPRSAA